MKTRILPFAILLLLTISSSAILAQPATLEVVVTNIKEIKGSLRASLFTNESMFLKEEYRGQVVKVTGQVMTILFENLPKGDYALSVIHDENENGELDTNFMGIPNEGFAFGNNAQGTFGPPSFDKTLVEISEGVTKHSIRLKYY